MDNEERIKIKMPIIDDDWLHDAPGTVPESDMVPDRRNDQPEGEPDIPLALMFPLRVLRSGERTCPGCGCTDARACLVDAGGFDDDDPEGCHWVEWQVLCSACLYPSTRVAWPDGRRVEEVIDKLT